MKIGFITRLTLLFTAIGLFFCTVGSAGLFDDITKSISEAGDAIMESGCKLVDEVTEVGQELGVIEKEEKTQPAETQPVRTQKARIQSAETQSVKTQQAEIQQIETKKTEPAKPAPSFAKLPGGVSSRIKKMDKELDKVEKKLAKGAGSSVDRANRAKLDLQRAQKYMKEIETRYAGKYSPNHPDMLAATGRLANVELAHAEALGTATAEQAQLVRKNKEAQATEDAEARKIADEKQRLEDTEKAARAESIATCEQWEKKLNNYTFGDKHFNSYQTQDDQLLAGWKANYDEAKQLVSEYPRGTCSQADSQADLIAQKMQQFEAIYQAAVDKKQQAARDKGEIIFGGSPFSAGSSGTGQKEFKAGDNIYGIIQVVKPWSEIYGSKQNFNIRVDAKIDGNKIHAQFIKIKDQEYADRAYLIFNVAPRVEDLQAYSNPHIEYGKSTPVIKQGPNELSHHLSKLAPGRHTVEFEIKYYGKVWAAGDFNIEGGDFTPYAKLHNQIAESVVAARTLPPAKMQNKKFEKDMTALLLEAGWSNVYRLNVVDKDWWIERVDGGNTAVKARYMAAVALTKNDDGSYHYKKCTFHQDRLITGGFSALYLSYQGAAIPITKENIDK